MIYVDEKNDLFFYLNPERRAYTHFAALHKDPAFVIFFHNALGKWQTKSPTTLLGSKRSEEHTSEFQSQR